MAADRMRSSGYRRRRARWRSQPAPPPVWPITRGGAHHVVPDSAPRVRIQKPGKDLAFTTPDQTVEVTIEADDSEGLRNLELRYTRMSGSGESFEFAEGQVPVQIHRSSATRWTATANGRWPGSASKTATRWCIARWCGTTIRRRSGCPRSPSPSTSASGWSLPAPASPCRTRTADTPSASRWSS